jgi:hypothetical protein
MVAGFGVAGAVGALVFLIGLAVAVRSTLVDEVFPLDRLEVSAKAKSLDLSVLRLGFGSDTLNDAAMDELAAIPGVRRVFPKMKLTVPAVASGGSALLGAGLQTDLVADGIDPRLVEGEIGDAFQFEGLETDKACRSDRDCGDDAHCVGRGFDAPGLCRRYVPVLVSNHLVELYNGSFRRAYKLPQINPDAVVGFTFEMSFGTSTIRSTGRVPVRERMRLVGFSDRAIPLGVTLPLDFVRAMNVRFGKAKAADAYHSAILELEAPRAAPDVIAAVQARDLAVTDRGARRAADIMAMLLGVFSLVGGTILAVAVAAVGHSFFVTVWIRRREIGVLRALGASRSDLRLFFLSEAGLVGAVAGLVGVVAAVMTAKTVDWIAAEYVPDFPYKPESFFQLPSWLLLGSIALAVIACLVGALIPVWRATAQDPAEALTSL